MARMRSGSPDTTSDAETRDQKSTLAAAEFTNIEFEDLGKQ